MHVDWGMLTIKDLIEVAVFVGGVLWHFGRIDARLMLLERLVNLLVDRSGMSAPEGSD